MKLTKQIPLKCYLIKIKKDTMVINLLAEFERAS